MEQAYRRSGAPLFGVILLVAGVAMLAGNLGILDYGVGDLFRDFWPAILLIIAAFHLAEGRFRSAIFLGVLGGVLLLFTLDVIERGFFRRWWPLALVAAGGWMIYRFFRPAALPPLFADGEPIAESADSFRIFQMLGGSNRTVTSTSFRAGEATAVLGGVEIDLRQAGLAPEGARIAATAILGGVVLKVPPDWDVTVTGAPLLGGIEDKRQPRSRAGDAPAQRLEVQATVVMGGLEIV